MTWIVVACAAVAVAVIVLSLRAGNDPADTDSAPEEIPRAPKPGEGMRRVEHVENVPDGYVMVHGPLPTEEAYVVHGLLRANGISAAMVRAFGAITEYSREVPATMSIAVFQDQVDEAAEVLREAGVGGTP